MEILTGRIGSGKTVELVRMAYKNKAIIVTTSKYGAECVMHVSEEMGMPITCIGYQEFLSYKVIGCRGCREKDSLKFYIDNIECFLDLISGSTVAGFVCDAENVTIKEKIDGKFYKRDLVDTYIK